ncbi:MAG: hypothetical protein NT079_01970 [Candidatus Omnitrophica bacterium]|nr:hypothetical protein [Candidatus Omnitrophota bacterium]
MTPKRLDPQSRKEKILAYVVDEYIHKVEPISSGQIVEECFSDLSSATVRNVLAELEDDGLLTHPHTSSGRVPTQAGYRYYVNHLMHEIKLLAEEKKRILSEYQEGICELEKLLHKTSEVLAQETRCPSIISFDADHDKVFCHGMSFVAGYPEFHNINRIHHILQVLEAKERLLELINRNLEKKIKIYVGDEVGCDDIEGCSLVISKFGRKKGLTGRLALLGPTCMNYEKAISTLEYFSELIDEMLENEKI